VGIVDILRYVVGTTLGTTDELTFRTCLAYAVSQECLRVQSVGLASMFFARYWLYPAAMKTDIANTPDDLTKKDSNMFKTRKKTLPKNTKEYISLSAASLIRLNRTTQRKQR
jgi:hypothetical protein